MQLQRDGRLWSASSRAFHSAFRTGLQHIGCEHFPFVPSSLRRGGATREYLLSGDLSKVTVRGRWCPQRTAKTYIQDGAAILAEMRFQQSARSSLQTFSDTLIARVRAH
eukprot:8377632-Pyramimonas_sp.AAC.1